MPSKKKEPALESKVKGSRELTKAEAFYVERHCKSRSLEQLAADTGAPAMSVQLYLDKLEESGYSPPQEPTGAEAALKAAGVEVKNGVVSMTRGGAEKGDEAARMCDPEKYKKARLRNCEHPIYP